MTDDQKDEFDPMAGIDASVQFVGPIVNIRRSLIEAGMSPEAVDHICVDFAHLQITLLQVQMMGPDQFRSFLGEDTDDPSN